MDEHEFTAHVRAALEDVPPELARALQNIAIVVEDENPDDPDLFGWYDGLGPTRDRAGALPTASSSTGSRSWSRFTTRKSFAARSASPSSTRSATTSGSTKSGSKSSATAEPELNTLRE